MACGPDGEGPELPGEAMALPSHRAVVLLAALATATALAAPASAAGKRGAQCGDVLTADAYLAGDLHCTDGAGITLDGPVTLDLRGHTLRGDGAGVAVSLTPTGRARVRNGSIVGWGSGVDAGTEWGAYVEADIDDVTFTGNGAAVSGWNTRYAITRSLFVENGTGVSGFYSFVDVIRSEFRDNQVALDGAAGGSFVLTDSLVTGSGTALSCSEVGCTVRRSKLRDNLRAVDFFYTGVTIEDSEVSGSDAVLDGRWASGVLLDGNVFQDNGTVFRVRYGVHASVVGNLFKDNTSAITDESDSDMFDSGVELRGNTIKGGGDGVLLTRASASLQGNSVFKNSGHGIVAPGAEDLGGNVAYRNGIDPQCTGVVCAGR